MLPMRIYPFELAPVLPDDVVFRQSRLWALLGAAILALVMGGVIFLFVHGVIPPWFGWLAVVGTALIALPLVRKCLGAFTAANWVLRLYGQRILIKVGPSLSADPLRVFVVEFQHKEIEWVRSYRKVIKVRDAAGENVQSSSTWLELKPRGADLEELKSCVKTASAPRQRHGWTLSTDIPVSVTGDGVVRVEWFGKYSVMAPSIKQVLRLLGTDIPVQAMETERNDFTGSDADKKKMEQQIIEYVEGGRILEAAHLARRCYGYSLTEARKFVAQLEGKDFAALPRDRAQDQALGK